ncbi:hypothetical protein SAMN05216167_14412 [Spirosoma endophyticum]|uniref:Uncharacterized protein n=1 Tax=Spirosoma endophyticum TaxID=662367 RepID=A0A1I2HJI7_9BACT|nr:hypothetical protein SAMN05216167_14412 [Spirosoma endophyticum]
MICTSCGSNEDSTVIADAQRDLSIKPRLWKPVIKTNPFRAEIVEGPSFELTNNSKTKSYHRIDLEVYFFDKAGNSLDTIRHREARNITAGKSLLVKYISTASIDTRAKTAKAVIRHASSN